MSRSCFRPAAGQAQVSRRDCLSRRTFNNACERYKRYIANCGGARHDETAQQEQSGQTVAFGPAWFGIEPSPTVRRFLVSSFPFHITGCFGTRSTIRIAWAEADESVWRVLLVLPPCCSRLLLSLPNSFMLALEILTNAMKSGYGQTSLSRR